MHYMEKDIVSPCSETTEVSSLQETSMHFDEKESLHARHEYKDSLLKALPVGQSCNM